MERLPCWLSCTLPITFPVCPDFFYLIYLVYRQVSKLDQMNQEEAVSLHCLQSSCRQLAHMQTSASQKPEFLYKKVSSTVLILGNEALHWHICCKSWTPARRVIQLIIRKRPKHKSHYVGIKQALKQDIQNTLMFIVIKYPYCSVKQVISSYGNSTDF